MKNSRIDSYYNPVYQYTLVVANRYTKLEDLQNLYIYADGVELDSNILDGLCTTSCCKRKEDGALVVLVKHNKDTDVTSLDKNLDLINTCSHEATHVALDIYEGIGQNICFCSPEPFCYLQAWATECIYKTITNK